MTTPAPGPQDPPGGPPAAPPPGETEKARLDRLEQAQAEQGGKLDRVLELLQGDGAEPSTAAPAGPDIAGMVRRAVEDVGAEKERKAAEAAHAAEHQRLSAPPERPPTQPQGVRARIQSRMYGPAE